MESERLPSFQNFHMRAAADVSTWLYRVTHSDYDSTVLSSIGPGSISFAGATYQLDLNIFQCNPLLLPHQTPLSTSKFRFCIYTHFPFISLHESPCLSASSSRQDHSYSLSSTTTIATAAAPPSPLSYPAFKASSSTSPVVAPVTTETASNHTRRKGKSREPSFSDHFVEISHADAKSTPFNRGAPSNTSSVIGASPDMDYHIIQLSCSMPSTANLSPSSKPHSKPIPLPRPPSNHKHETWIPSVSEMSVPPPSLPPLPPPAPPSTHPSPFQVVSEYEVIAPSTSIDSLSSLSESLSGSDDLSSEERPVMVELVSEGCVDGVFLMEQQQQYEMVTHMTPPSDAEAARVRALVARWRAQFWFTYRTGIDLPGAHTDTGWGCMHRSGQMLLARAFVTHALGPSFVLADLDTAGAHARRTRPEYRRVLGLFLDTPHAPFGLASICRAGQDLFGLRPGAWYSPSALAWILAKLNHVYKDSPFRILVSNTTLVSTQILAVPFQRTVLLISLRLGTRTFHESYTKNLLDLFIWPQFLGIAGGKKHASLYFTGTWLPSGTLSEPQQYRSAQLLYLDPHCPQKSDPSLHALPNPHYHTDQLRALSIRKLDPSMLLGFVFLSQADVQDFVHRVQAWKHGALFFISDHDTAVLEGNDLMGWSEVDSLRDVHSA